MGRRARAAVGVAAFSACAGGFVACTSFGAADSSQAPTAAVPSAPSDAGAPGANGAAGSSAPDAADAGDASDAADARADAATLPFDAGAPCQGAPPCNRLVFVTSGTFPGTLGGVDQANAACNAAAQASNYAELRARHFHAFLSSSRTAAMANVSDGALAYRRVDGVDVAASFTGLLSMDLLAPIDHDENGVEVTSTDVWTGTQNTGTFVSPACNDWTSAGTNGKIGNAAAVNKTWIEVQDKSCATSARLYCFED